LPSSHLRHMNHTSHSACHCWSGNESEIAAAPAAANESWSEAVLPFRFSPFTGIVSKQRNHFCMERDGRSGSYLTHWHTPGYGGAHPSCDFQFHLNKKDNKEGSARLSFTSINSFCDCGG